MILGGKYGKRRSIQSEDLFFFFLEIGMILGEKYGKSRLIQSEDLFLFFFFLENGIILTEKNGKRRSIQVKTFFLEIIMIFGEKLQSARSKTSFVFREHQFLRILASGP